MNLKTLFLLYLKEQGIDINSIPVDDRKDCTALSFYNDEMCICMCFYNDNETVEIFVQKEIEISDRLGVLEIINNLNFEYIGITFYEKGGILRAKSVCKADNDLNPVLDLLARTTSIAKRAFLSF